MAGFHKKTLILFKWLICHFSSRFHTFICRHFVAHCRKIGHPLGVREAVTSAEVRVTSQDHVTLCLVV